MRDKNGNLLESTDKQIEFQATAGVLQPMRATLKNGSAYTELIASTVSTNASITAQIGDVKSNSINISFSNTFTPTPLVTDFDINDGDAQAVVALKCPVTSSGWGSGVIFTSDGMILTNNHVVENAGTCGVYVADNIQAAAKLKYYAYTIARTSSPDVAILKISKDSADNYINRYTGNYLNLVSSSDLRVGASIMTLGYPFFGSASNTVTVTKGIVSGTTIDFFKTDIKITGGNSGGPVIDKNKRVVGIIEGTYTGDRENLGVFIENNKIGPWAKSQNIYWP